MALLKRLLTICLKSWKYRSKCYWKCYWRRYWRSIFRV